MNLLTLFIQTALNTGNRRHIQEEKRRILTTGKGKDVPSEKREREYYECERAFQQNKLVNNKVVLHQDQKKEAKQFSVKRSLNYYSSPLNSRKQK